MKNYRKGVGIMLINRANLVFTGQRSDASATAWQMPQGGIELNETPLEAAWREMEEEVGSKNAELLAFIPYWVYYDLPPNLQKRLWQQKFIGQKQKWFLFRFLGEDSEINITNTGEFKNWKWQEIDNIISSAVDFKKELYQQVIRFFKRAIH